MLCPPYLQVDYLSIFITIHSNIYHPYKYNYPFHLDVYHLFLFIKACIIITYIFVSLSIYDYINMSIHMIVSTYLKVIPGRTQSSGQRRLWPWCPGASRRTSCPRPPWYLLLKHIFSPVSTWIYGTDYAPLPPASLCSTSSISWSRLGIKQFF